MTIGINIIQQNTIIKTEIISNSWFNIKLFDNIPAS